MFPVYFSVLFLKKLTKWSVSAFFSDPTCKEKTAESPVYDDTFELFWNDHKFRRTPCVFKTVFTLTKHLSIRCYHKV